ncbi:MAG: CpsD/CapB family tyrosine-protein kinase [Firmicutes bacterium]|nr:CpsD/CapB family tyrosine-protein kinase [Bacillota bacterium]
MSRSKSKSKIERKLLIKTLRSNAPAVEAFRSLRTNIQFTNIAASTKVIALTSAGPSEGKSSVAGNLASVMALAGSKCILVDADLRKPVQAKQFGVSGRVGLTNVLMGSLSVEDALVSTEIEGLRLLPSGPIPPNPAELLGSALMKSTLEELRERADIVIVDTPPLLPVTDAAVLASIVDGTILVVKSGETHKQAVIRAKQSLESVNARILGVVLNGVIPKTGYYQHYYYHYAESNKGA